MKLVKLKDVCHFSRGLTYSKNDEVNFSNNIVLRANNIKLENNSLQFDDIKYISNKVNIDKSKKLRKGSILICTASGSKSHMGKVAFVESDYDFAFGGFMAQITPLDNCVGKYLFYQLISPSFKKHLLNISDGTNINNLKFSDIENYLISLPSIETQNEIVEKLDKAFAEIDLLEGNLKLREEKTNELLKSILGVMFKSTINEKESNNSSANQELTMKMATKPLGELCKLMMGRTPSRSNSSYWDPERKTQNIWISIADMTKSVDGVLIDSKEYLSDEGSKTFPKVKTGTLLLSFKLSIGKLAIAGTDLQSNEAIVAMTELSESLILRDYLYYYLYGFDWSETLAGRFKVKGSTLNKRILEELSINFPSLEEQRKIVEKLDSAFAEIASLRAQFEMEKETTTALRHSLLSSAFIQEEAVA